LRRRREARAFSQAVVVFVDGLTLIERCRLMLVLSKHFHADALAVLRELPADQLLGELPDAKGFFVARGEKAPEGFAFLERLQDGELVGVLCQRK